MKPQELQFELMKQASFNSFNGPEVVKSLKENNDLWKACVMYRETLVPTECGCSLIALRDLPRAWNVDTLFLTVKTGKERELVLLAKGWNPDEVTWLSDKEAGDSLGSWPPKEKVLRVWWD